MSDEIRSGYLMANTKRKCKQCKEYFLADEMVKLPFGWFCNHAAAIKFGIEKTTKQKKTVQRVKDNETRQRLKKPRKVEQEAREAVQYYVRMRDYNDPCISCGEYKAEKFAGSVYDGGHYRSVGSAKHMQFNVFNINKQCVRCNRLEGGNSDYRINLVAKYGIEKVTELETDQRIRQYRREDFERIKRIFRKRGRWYEKRRKG